MPPPLYEHIGRRIHIMKGGTKREIQTNHAQTELQRENQAQKQTQLCIANKCKPAYVFLTLASAPAGPSASGLPVGLASRSCWSIDGFSFNKASISALWGACDPPEIGAAVLSAEVPAAVVAVYVPLSVESRRTTEVELLRNMAILAELVGDLRGDGGWLIMCICKDRLRWLRARGRSCNGRPNEEGEADHRHRLLLRCWRARDQSCQMGCLRRFARRPRLSGVIPAVSASARLLHQFRSSRVEVLEMPTHCELCM